MGHREEDFGLALTAIHPIFVPAYSSIIAGMDALAFCPIAATIRALCWHIGPAVNPVHCVA